MNNFLMSPDEQRIKSKCSFHRFGNPIYYINIDSNLSDFDFFLFVGMLCFYFSISCQSALIKFAIPSGIPCTCTSTGDTYRVAQKELENTLADLYAAFTLTMLYVTGIKICAFLCSL